jgi:UDPglucose--hexose-1-phosphate uridylyltransferase
MPFIPPTVEKELSAALEFSAKDKEGCLFCRLLEEELKARDRVVTANDSFVAFVPYAARFPAEIAIYARRHVRTLMDLEERERRKLAEVISVIRQKYDNLYGFLMPLMMAVKQAPLRKPEVTYHFHIQFLPLQRAPNKLKYLATMETGFGTFLADTAPEEVAENLRRSAPATEPYSGV